MEKNRKEGTQDVQNQQDTQLEQDAQKKQEKKGFWKTVRQFPVLTTLLVSLIAILIVFVWKEVQMQQRLSALEAVSLERYESMEDQYVLLLSKSVVWSVRNEWMRGNEEQLQILLRDLVQDTPLTEICVLNPTGEVLLSTKAGAIGSKPSLPTVEETELIRDDSGSLKVVAPVMGYDVRLGTLVLTK